MELMNSKELHEFMDWELNPDDHDDPVFFGGFLAGQALEILKEYNTTH